MYPRNTPKQTGVALVITLSMLVLLSAITIAFLSSASIERKSSNAYQNLFDARQAADSAVNLVISNIRDATKAESEGEIGSATWASQPGAIRVFRSSDETSQVYKLYSAEKMHEKDSEYAPQNEVPPDFMAKGEVPPGWVDLNEPIVHLASNSTPSDPRYDAVYPIVDPATKYRYTQGTTNGNGEFNGGRFETTATGTTDGAVDGFFCHDFRDEYRKDKNGYPLRLLPLPVRWVYILRDGSYATLGQDGKINGATKDNPIVQRVAFWTDDDSCKLNINTASEGTYWDTPTIASKYESGDANANDGSGITPISDYANLSVSQPTKGEFQRYPGHPATTCLSPAIRWLFPGYRSDAGYNPDADVAFKETIYRLAPRIANGEGTTQGGSKVLFAKSTAGHPLQTIHLDNRHLYSTLDEYFFRPDRTGLNIKPKLVDNVGVAGEAAIPTFDPSAIDRVRFFLTPHSRAPELNLFGMPRVAIWPIHGDKSKRTPFDESFAFASKVKVGPNSFREFYFQRRDPNSQTSDYDSIPRNKEIYQYLQYVSSLKVPWLAASLKNKFGELERNQILTNIFDYVRCANLVDTSSAADNANHQYIGFTPNFWPQDANGNTMLEAAMPKLNSGQVMPIRIGDTQGFGRFVTPTEVGVLFYQVPTRLSGQPFPPGFKGIRAVLLMEMYCPSHGYAGLRENYGLQVLVDDDFKWRLDNSALDGTPFKLPQAAFTRVTVDAYTAPIGRMFMPVRAFHNQFLYDPGWNPVADPVRGWNTVRPKTFPRSYPVGGTDPLRVYPFVSDILEVPATVKNFGFVGGSIRIRTYPPNANPETYTAPGGAPSPTAVQTVNVHFDNVSPILRWPYATHLPDFEQRLGQGINGSRNRLGAGDNDTGYQWLQCGDIIRSMEMGGPTRGDQRLAANLREVPSAYFTSRGGPSVYASNRERVHGFRMGRGGSLNPGTTLPAANGPSKGKDNQSEIVDGKLVAQAHYRGDRTPPMPWNVPYASMAVPAGNPPGDWDRGISKNIDGAFINKPDEGTMNWDASRTNGLKLPYWLGYSGYEELRAIHFTPNRIMPSAVMFGSLPRMGRSGRPWETLLFRPASASGPTGHDGVTSPADHYWLDLFDMPVVEPYAISEPFSTGGKVNMNYMAAPFSYWKAGGTGTKVTDSYLIRRTALHGVFRSTKMLIAGNGIENAGHNESPLTGSSSGTKTRFRIDEERTLDEMHARLADPKDIFRSASEICDINLQAVNQSRITPQFWINSLLTGDNYRERPYAHIYPRLTTKSNVYTVHIRAQALRKGKDTEPNEWNEKKDSVVGEYRGSTTIERFLDPNDKALEGYNELTKPQSLDPYYRFRIVQTRQY